MTDPHPYYGPCDELAADGGCAGCAKEADARERWNATADKHNQWDDLGGDEKHKLAASGDGEPPDLSTQTQAYSAACARFIRAIWQLQIARNEVKKARRECERLERELGLND